MDGSLRATDAGADAPRRREPLERVGREHQAAQRRQPQIDEDLAADSVVARIRPKSQVLVGLDSVHPLILQHVRLHLVDEADAAPLLLLVDDRSVSFLLDEFHGGLELTAAVALD